MAKISGTKRADLIGPGSTSSGVVGGPSTGGGDRIHSGNGDDRVHAGGGNDEVYGENGDDHLWGDAGHDLVFGGNGRDEVHGGEGNDEVIGGNGGDQLWGDVGDDRLHGGRGTDEAVYFGSRTNYAVAATGSGITVEDLNGAADGRDEGTDTLNGIERLRFLGIATPSTALVSSSASGELANGPSNTFGGPEISGNGRFVAFLSEATNLVAGDTSDLRDVFVKDLETGEVTLVSASSTGEPGNGTNFFVSISDDGDRVAFLSYADNLVTGEADGLVDIFVKDLGTGEVMLATSGSNGGGNSSPYYQYSLSGDGRYVAFVEIGDDLLPGDANGTSDILVKDLETGILVSASINGTGEQANSGSFEPAISPDGRYVAFSSAATNLVPDDFNGFNDIFVKDMQTGAVTIASVGSTGTTAENFSSAPSISDDGRFVAFTSLAANLVSGDGNSSFDVYVKDMLTGTVTLASSSNTEEQGNGASFDPSISADGLFVAFGSSASNLVPGDNNGMDDVFIKNLQTGAVTLASVSNTGAQANKGSGSPSLSADGSLVAFASSADNLVLGDTNGASDVFVRDLASNGGKETVFAIERDGSLTPLDIMATSMSDDFSLG